MNFNILNGGSSLCESEGLKEIKRKPTAFSSIAHHATNSRG